MHDDMTLVGTFLPYSVRKKFKILNKLDLFELWHRDPQTSGQDCCGFNDYKKLSHWRHWELRFIPLVRLRKKIFERCAGCGGPSTKNNPINFSAAFETPKTPHFWWNRPNSYHVKCWIKHVNSTSKLRHSYSLEQYNRGYIDATFELSPQGGYRPPEIPRPRGISDENWDHIQEFQAKQNETFIRRVTNNQKNMR